jgi:hypothetical protein
MRRNHSGEEQQQVRIFALDPGTTETGYVVLDTRALRVTHSGVVPNHEMLHMLQHQPWRNVDALAIERFEARGMPISEDSIGTIIWLGRFVQQWHRPEDVVLIKRSTVKLHLCGNTRAKDPNVRQAVIDRVGAPGTKKQPGPTYGVTSHAWQALGVAVCAQDKLNGQAL